MKRIVLLITALMLCLALSSCEALLQKARSAVTGTEVSMPPEDYVATVEGDEYEYEIYKSYIKITEYLGEDKNVVIPDEIDGKSVTVIGSLCFCEKTVETVEIPDTVTTVEASAFYCASELKEIKIPDTVEFIGIRAFGWCNSLEKAELGKGVSEIPDFCFNHCISLAEAEIPENIQNIGVRAFSYCEKLVDITIPQTVVSVGDRAFASCRALEFVTFENPDISLGADVFSSSENVAVICEKDNNAYKYCEENSLRWSTSKSVAAVVLEKPEENSELTSEEASNE